MKASRTRKAGVINLVDTVLANVAKGGGLRAEIRIRHTMAEDLVDGLALGAAAIRKLLSWVEGGLRTKKIPVEDYAKVVQDELAAAIQKSTFKGMANAGPNPDNEDQVQRLQQKCQQWSFLVANIGLHSGHFARHLANGSSSQDNPRRLVSGHIDMEQEKAQEAVQEEPDVQQVPEEQEARSKEQEQKGARSKNKKKKYLGSLLQATVLWT